MTARELLGWTTNMGAFEIAIAWAVVPTATKNQLPSSLVSSLNLFAIAIGIYNSAVGTYNTAKMILDQVNQAQVIVSLPTNPAVAADYATEQLYQTALSTSWSNISSDLNPINIALDQPLPV